MKKKDEFIVENCFDDINLTEYPDYMPAKNGDSTAAERLIRGIISDDKKAKIKDLFESGKVLFISMPGTTKLNQLPANLANFICEQTNNVFIDGDKYVDTLHKIPMKLVAKQYRLFAPRLFEISPENKGFFENLKKIVQKNGMRVIVIEDFFTTGASVNSFKCFLQKSGLKVDGFFSIRGSAQIRPTVKSVQKLQAALDGFSDEKMKADIFAENLTETQLFTLRTIVTTGYNQASPKDKKLIANSVTHLYKFYEAPSVEEAYVHSSVLEKNLKTLSNKEFEMSPLKQTLTNLLNYPRELFFPKKGGNSL